MRHFFLLAGSSFAIGIVIGHFYPTAGPIAAGWIVVGLPVLWLIRGRKGFIPFFALIVVCTGVVSLRLERMPARDPVERQISDDRLSVNVKVLSLPDLKERGRSRRISFVGEAISVEQGTRYRPKIRPAKGRLQVFWIQPSSVPEPGDQWRLYGTLKRPRRAANPGEFDQERYLAGQNIRAVLEVIGPRSGRRTAISERHDLRRWIGRTRLWIAGRIDQVYRKPASSIIKALILGIRDDIGPGIRSAFMKTGTVHLLAISGLNITIVAGGFFMVFLMAGIPRRAVAGLTIAVVIVYVILSGAGIPVRRAGLMAVTVLIALIRGRRPVSLNVFCAAFFLMLLAAPEDLWNIGFQLSFLSVLSLIALMPLFPDRRFFSLGGSLAVTVGTFPLVLYYFNVVSPIGILANILAIPLFDAALFLSFFSLPVHDIPVIGGCLTHVSSLLVTAGLAWIEWLAGWPFGYWYLQRPTIFRLAVYYGTLTAMVAALRFRSIHRQWIIPGCWIALGATAACIVWSPVSPGFRATVLATGRDPVVHVRFSNGANWLINAGRSFPSDQGERVILPYLRRCGIRSLDGVVLTGLLKRYRGGLPSIFRDVAVREVLVPADERLPPDMERHSKMIRRFVTGSEIVSGHETMKVFRDGAGDWKVLITVGRKSIALRRSVNDVSAGPETDVAVIPYLRKTADLNEAVRSTTFILAGGEASAIRFLTGSVRNVYRLDVTGALEIRPSTKGFTVFSCARA